MLARGLMSRQTGQSRLGKEGREEGGRRAGNLCSLTDSPAGSQLGNTFPSLRARALGCSRSC